MELSIVMPLYNSEQHLKNVIKTIYNELTTIEFEAIFINDGSTDKTEEICQQLIKSYPFLTVINLKENTGEYNAVLCGLKYAVGNYIVIIDDDLQNPPSEILKLYSKIKSSNCDLVYARYSKKHYALWRKAGSIIFNLMSVLFFAKPYSINFNSFKIITQNLAKKIIQYKGPYPFFDAFIFKLTSKISYIKVSHFPSLRNKSSYNFIKLFKIVIFTLMGHSNVLILIVLFFIFFFINTSATFFFSISIGIILIIQIIFKIYGFYFAKYKNQYQIKKIISSFPSSNR